jgi:type III pantothenate kinase
MLLVMDVGNTNTVVGVYRGEELIHHWRLASLRDRTVDELGVLVRQLFTQPGLEPEAIDAIVVASVVPPLLPSLAGMASQYFALEALFVEPGIKTGMPILYDNPQDVGADRIANGVAAHTRYGGPVLVVDFGTATTIDAISKRGEYLGGVIAPGVQISSEALFERAARLPRVEIRRPLRVIGRTTVQSMQAGLFYGYLGLIEGLLGRLREELDPASRVVATGGLAPVFAAEFDGFDVVDPFLTLEGLRLIHERNKA